MLPLFSKQVKKPEPEAVEAPKQSSLFGGMFGKAPEPEPAPSPAPPASMLPSWLQRSSTVEDVADEQPDDEQRGLMSFFRTSRGDSGSESASGGEGSGNTSSQASMFTMFSAARLKIFVGCLLMGLFFMGLGSAFLPLVVLRPHKFAFCFTMGSYMFMASFAALYGPKAYCQKQLTSESLPRTIVFFSSSFFTLWAALIARSYILVVVGCSIQIGSMVWNAVSVIPGGKTGFRALLHLSVSTAKLLFSSILKLLTK